MAATIAGLIGSKGRLLSTAFALLSAGGVTLFSCTLPSFGLQPFPETRPWQPGMPVTQITDAPDASLGGVSDPGQFYAWPDRALVLNQVFADAPPDIGFAVDDVEAWLWKSGDNHVRIVEPLEFGVREYYFAPGAQTPFFVRDPEYGYGFNNGVLVVVVDRGGYVLAPDRMPAFADPAGRYLARAETVILASRGRERWRVTPDRWARRAPVIQAEAQQWSQAAASQPGWQAYRQASTDSRHFEGERRRREASARRTRADYVRQSRERPRPNASFTASRAEPRRWAELEQRGRPVSAPAPDGSRRVLDFDAQAPSGERGMETTRPRRADRVAAPEIPRGARGQADWRAQRDQRRAERAAAPGYDRRAEGERRQAEVAARRERAEADRRIRTEQASMRRAAEAEQRRQAMAERRAQAAAEDQMRRRADDMARQQAAEQRRMEAQAEQERRRAERAAAQAERRSARADDDGGQGEGRRRRRRDDGG